MNFRAVSGWASTAAGVALASYLLGLKLARLPCLGGGCDVVINSAYGSVAGIPVSLFGLGAWILLLFGETKWRRIGALVLVLGSLWFVAVQVLWLQTICPLCCAHAACAVVAACLCDRGLPPPVAFAVGSVLGWLGLVGLEHSAPQGGIISPLPTARELTPPAATDAQASTSLKLPAAAKTPQAGQVQQPKVVVRNQPSAVQPVQNGASVAAPRNFSGLAWLGPVSNDSPLLAISFTCPHCVDGLWWLLDEAERRPLKAAPKVMMLASGANLPMNRLVIAGVLAASAEVGPAAGFARAMRLLREHRMDMLTGKLERIQAVFESDQLAYRRYVPAAEILIERHHEVLKVIGVKATPYLLTTSGAGQYVFDRSKF